MPLSGSGGTPLSGSGNRSAQTDDPARERARRRIVWLVFGFYLLLIFEGALRKWVLTSFGQALFFVRDPLVLAIYVLALRHRFWPRHNPVLAAGLALSAMGFLLIALQAIGVASSIPQWPILAAYGWRNYFLYIPLPFVLGEALRPLDLQRLVKLTFLLAFPIAFLVLLQFRSPLEAPINVGFGASAQQQYRGLAVDMDHTRPMGTFTSDVGEKEFVASSTAMLLALWIAPVTRRFLKSWQVLPVTCAVLTCLAVSGSRGAMVHCSLILLTAIASTALMGRSGATTRAILLPTIIALAAVVLYPIVFPDGYTTFMNRWNAAQAVEVQHFHGGLLGRALTSFYDFIGLMGDAPLPGYGLGLAGNASLTLGVTIPGFNGWAESDWARHIVDLGPLFGLLFIAYRIVLVGWLGIRCLVGARAGGDPLPLLLFGYVSVELLYGELTGHGSVNGYGWLFAGLALAAANVHLRATPAAGRMLADPLALAPFPNLMR
jgi:hypothetical protein